MMGRNAFTIFLYEYLVYLVHMNISGKKSYNAEGRHRFIFLMQSLLENTYSVPNCLFHAQTIAAFLLKYYKVCVAFYASTYHIPRDNFLMDLLVS